MNKQYQVDKRTASKILQGALKQACSGDGLVTIEDMVDTLRMEFRTGEAELIATVTISGFWVAVVRASLGAEDPEDAAWKANQKPNRDGTEQA